jgi:hypothetical protein
VLIENRSGLVVANCVTRASGIGERAAALLMVSDLPRPPRVTLGADRGYDSADFVLALRGLGVTPHLAQNTSNRSSAIDRRTTRHLGYVVSQRSRKPLGRRKTEANSFGTASTSAALALPRDRSENPGVGGSIPSLPTRFFASLHAGGSMTLTPLKPRA